VRALIFSPATREKFVPVVTLSRGSARGRRARAPKRRARGLFVVNFSGSDTRGCVSRRKRSSGDLLKRCNLAGAAGPAALRRAVTANLFFNCTRTRSLRRRRAVRKSRTRKCPQRHANAAAFSRSSNAAEGITCSARYSNLLVRNPGARYCKIERALSTPKRRSTVCSWCAACRPVNWPCSR